MCDVGDHLERVQLVFAQVGSLGSLPQFNHTGLPERCIRVKHRGGEKKHGVMTNSQRQLGASPVLTHTQEGESFQEEQQWQMLSFKIQSQQPLLISKMI